MKKQIAWSVVLLAALVALLSLDVIARAVTLFFQESALMRRLAIEIGTTNPKSVLILVEAAFVGLLGAFTFFLGVFLGFIGPESREKTLRFFGGGTDSAVLVALFCVSGGIVAAVFQAAQPGTFAPIQAFVLGATWPSVVTRIMSGDGANLVSGSKLTDASPASIPSPAGKSASSAEVVI
ncbi:MAG: hypothetical protein HYV96_01610 [Opitutae bacterium]|nr:hypothetical protein [Opitutae bacterium]